MRSQEKGMTNEPLAAITWHDSNQIATVLDGIAGTVREGYPLDPDDMDAIAQNADWVWQAGPRPTRADNLDFESAMRSFSRATTACIAGLPQEPLVEASAHRMAVHLRALAIDSESLVARKELPFAVGQQIDRLARKYARFAPNPAEA